MNTIHVLDIIGLLLVVFGWVVKFALGEPVIGETLMIAGCVVLSMFLGWLAREMWERWR